MPSIPRASGIAVGRERMRRRGRLWSMPTTELVSLIVALLVWITLLTTLTPDR